MASYVDSEILKVDLSKEKTLNVITHLSPCLRAEDLRKQAECTTFEGRVRLARMHSSWRPTRAETLAKYQKNTSVSQALRERGNGKFKKNNLEDALEGYNLAVMFAKTTDEELGLAYASRSAVLIKMQDYEGALEDIELAMNHNCPIALADKLQNRRSKCNELILKRDRKKVASAVEKRKLFREQMLKIEANPLIPSAASYVKLKHNNIIGRHLIVDQDVPPGTVLIVENPYAATLHDEVNWETKHCHCCLRKIRRGIPCDVCVFVIYCGEACKQKAYQDFHRWECSCLPQLHCNSTMKHTLLAFRIICKVGPEELWRLFTTKDPKFFKLSGIYGTEEHCKYESDAYLSVYHLQTVSKHLDVGKRYNNAHVPLLWVDVLDNETNFFKEMPGNPPATPVGAERPQEIIEEFKNFVAALMLRHYESVPLNFSVITELTGFKEFSVSRGAPSVKEMLGAGARMIKPDLAEYAHGIYPVVSMLTHSCDSNTIRVNDVSKGTAIVVTNRRLKSGDILYTNYDMALNKHSKLDRQFFLRQRYYFNCQCVACKLDWPLVENFDGTTKYCCPSCSKKARDDGKCKEVKMYQLTGPKWKCHGCKKQYKERKLIKKFVYNAKNLDEVAHLMFLNEPSKAMKRMTEVIEYFRYNLSPYSPHEYMTQTMFLPNIVAISLWYAKTFH